MLSSGSPDIILKGCFKILKRCFDALDFLAEFGLREEVARVLSATLGSSGYCQGTTGITAKGT